jgi:galactokinase
MAIAGVTEPAALFARSFGSAPTHLARAPGRVNLIGEHIDYVGLPVFPIALQREVRMYFRARVDRDVRVVNVDPQYTQRDFTVSGEIERYPPGDWGNYLKAAAQELERRYGPLRGFDAVMESTLPVAAGLSSSSAVVVAAARCLLAASGLDVSVLELAAALAAAERYVGTQGGGMDQAICLGAERRSAARIDFAPLGLTHTAVPEEWRFVVASSMVRAEKSSALNAEYNARRKDCEEALYAVIAHFDTPRSLTSYADVLYELSPLDLEEAIDQVLSERLRKRFRHAVTEATRVALAEEAMRAANAPRFGGLMSASHASLRDDFDVSCEELDRLTAIAESAGAMGARLTGAGFGGCVVALSNTDHVNGVLDALRRDYYEPRGYPGPLERHLFVAEPSAGASVTAVAEAQ